MMKIRGVFKMSKMREMWLLLKFKVTKRKREDAVSALIREFNNN